MVIIERDPSVWVREKALNSIVNLDLLSSKLNPKVLNAKSKPEEVFHGSVTILNFIHQEIAPLVEDYYHLTKKQLPFDYLQKSSFISLSNRLIRRISPVGDRLITFNLPKLPKKLGYKFAPERRPAEITEEVLKRLYFGGIDPDAVEGLGKLSKEEAIIHFKKQILSSIK